jgi:hypothetical protein
VQSVTNKGKCPQLENSFFQQDIKLLQILASRCKATFLPSEGRGQGFESLRVRQIDFLDGLKKSTGCTGFEGDNSSGMREHDGIVQNGAPAAAA